MLPSWLGAALACAFALVAVHRGLRRAVPGSVMAAGMAVMSLSMAGVGPAVVDGPWWAAGFAAVTIWPLVPASRGGTGSGRIAHVLGGVAMVYMCAMPSMPTTGSAVHIAPTPTGHAMTDMGPLDLPVAPGPLGGAAALFGWVLGCYFLLGTITALTRRTADGTPSERKMSALEQAAMGFGTVVMLAAVA
jgi:hypothetical protein